MPTRHHIAAVTPDLGRPTRAKIVATIGPASDSPETIQRLIETGISVFRLNFSHGDLEEHERRLQTIRRIAQSLNEPVAILGDLSGPKIRIGHVPEPLELLPGQDVLLSRDADRASLIREKVAGSEITSAVLPTTFPALVDDVEPGHRVLINDGAIRMLAVERTPDARALRCRVTYGGIITSSKGINLPDTDLKVPAITERDWECVEWAVHNYVDFLALSFVRRAAEVRELKDRLVGMCPIHRHADHDPRIELGATIPVIAKIEKPQAVEAIDEIVDIADAIMVARGDLGVEMDLAQVPIVQKKIIARCQAFGKPCIVATQMLETMIENSSPTRAEVSDIANAIFDGAGALMLSGETAVGHYPLLVVEIMRRAIAAAEARIGELPSQASPPAKLVETRYATAALAHGAWHIARDVGAAIIVCWSEGGGTARYLSQNDFRIPIVAYTSSALAARRMALLKGVTPIHRAPPQTGSLAEFTDIVERDLLDRHWVGQDDRVILVAGKPLGEVRATNSIALLTIGDPHGGYRAHRS